MSSILTGIKLNEANPHNYDSDIDYYNALNRKTRGRSEDDYVEPHDDEPIKFRQDPKARPEYSISKDEDRDAGYNMTLTVKAPTTQKAEFAADSYVDSNWGAKKQVGKITPISDGVVQVHMIDNHKYGMWKPWKDEEPIQKPISFNESKTKKGAMITETRTYKLWESAGQKIAEAQLTADQINQIFQHAEKIQTAGGANRTMLGKGKDAASAVNKAWEELKTKVQNSGPVKGFDAMYDKAAEQLKQATGGDQGVMQYVQKYRDFAKKYPVAQSLIYATLIAAAGISGAGIGGAAALGLFKMADKLLQGEKFSSAAYQGAKTGAMAYGASKVGDLFRGSPQGAPTTAGSDATAGAAQDTLSATRQAVEKEAMDAIKSRIANGEIAPGDQGAIRDLAYKMLDGSGMPPQAIETSVEKLITRSMGDVGTGATNIASGITGNMGYDQAFNTYIQKFAQDPKNPSATIIQQAKQFAASKAKVNESIELTESQIFLVIGKIVERQRKLDEGIMDTVKGAASKAVDWAKTKGTNLTTKVTADKLLQSWKKAGSPTDSLDVAKVVQDAGVASDTIKQVYGNMKIPFAGEKGAGPDTARKIDVDPSSVAPPPTASSTPAQSTTSNATASTPASTPSASTAPAATSAEEQKVQTTYAQVRALIDKLDKRGKQNVVKTLKKNLGIALTEDQINELSTDLLANYKKKASADATAADKEGDYKRGNKRMSGIINATKKEFANDAKKLKEFAPVGGDDREPDEEEILRQLAAKWWLGTEQEMSKAQKTLAAMGWEIGQDESGDDDAGVFVIRVGDENGDSYIAFNHSELEELNEAFNNYHVNRTGFTRGARDDERHDLDTPKPTSPEVWALKINGKVWSKGSKDVTFTSKQSALNTRNAILKNRPDLEIGLVTKGGVAEVKGNYGIYSSDDYYNAKQGHEYGIKNPSIDSGAYEFEKDIPRSEPSGERGRPKNLKGVSKSLPADAFGRTTGKIPTGKTGRIHSMMNDVDEELDENLNKWFKEKWVRFGPDGKIRGDCARGDDSEGKPKCLPQSKAQNLGKKGRASAAARKRREDPNPERSGKAINVNTKNNTNEEQLNELVEPTLNYYTLSNGKMVQVSYRPNVNQSPVPFTDVEVSYVNPALKPQGGSFDSTGVASPWTNAPDGVKQSIQKFVARSQQGVAEEQLDELSCWSGYHRVAGTKAGFPGSCAKNKTNEEGVSEGQNQSQFKSKEDAIAYAKDKIKTFRDPEDGIEIWAMPKGGFDVVNTNNSNGRNHCISNGGKKLGTIGARHQGVAEAQHSCPHCGGEMVSEELMNEKKDACYYKVKSRYKVWPSAYASGALVKCRKSGADSWGNGGKKNEGVVEAQLDEKWTKKYKDSINCSNPKGFSQKAHCAGKQKNESAIMSGLNQLDEGWKEKLGAAALAGSMALGSAGANARVTPDGQGGFTGGLKPTSTVTAPADSKPAAESPRGFSKEYLQKAADPNRTGRYMISVEKAQELLKSMP